MRNYQIALIPGDGIGKEVIPAAVEVLQAAADGFAPAFHPFECGCEYCLRSGYMMPEDGLKQLRPFDAILLGAIGAGSIQPGSKSSVPDDVSLRGLLLQIRFEFDLHVNLRPVEVLPGIETPLKGKGADDVSMLFVRENTEGEYCGIGGRFKRGTADEFAIQQSIF